MCHTALINFQSTQLPRPSDKRESAPEPSTPPPSCGSVDLIDLTSSSPEQVPATLVPGSPARPAPSAVSSSPTVFVSSGRVPVQSLGAEERLSPDANSPDHNVAAEEANLPYDDAPNSEEEEAPVPDPGPSPLETYAVRLLKSLARWRDKNPKPSAKEALKVVYLTQYANEINQLGLSGASMLASMIVAQTARRQAEEIRPPSGALAGAVFTGKSAGKRIRRSANYMVANSELRPPTQGNRSVHASVFDTLREQVVEFARSMGVGRVSAFISTSSFVHASESPLYRSPPLLSSERSRNGLRNPRSWRFRRAQS